MLTGKTALVTGAAQGLGLAIAKAMMRENCFIYLCDVQEDPESVRPLLDSKAAAYRVLDVSDEDGWMSVLGEIAEENGKLDILVNNAGINIRETIEDMAAEHLDEMMAVNIKGPFLGIKHAIPLMRKGGGGSIINMSSICGLVGHRYTTAAYTATKGALTLLTKSIAVRYAKDNIRANSVHPSTVDTPLVRELFKDPEKKEQRLGEVPLGRLATTDDVAEAVLFLASDKASFLNGTALPVDGGLTSY